LTRPTVGLTGRVKASCGAVVVLTRPIVGLTGRVKSSCGAVVVSCCDPPDRGFDRAGQGCL
jgi:hypothetical protein